MNLRKMTGFLWQSLAPIIVLSTTACHAKDLVDVIVQLKRGETASQLNGLQQRIPGGTVKLELPRNNAVAMKVPRSELEMLILDDQVELVEEDPIMIPFSANGVMSNEGEDITWGLEKIQGVYNNIPPPYPGSECFKICSVDAGIALEHPDIPWDFPGDKGIMGREFGLPDGETWHAPLYNHGTHTAGVMVATPNNGLGIRGVLGDTDGFCMMVARVFPDSGQGNYDSVILEAVNWCADNGARVVSLSLGSPLAGTNVARKTYDSLYEQGVLVVSASGNDYSNTDNFPASFSTVLSVSAIDQNGNRGDFSSYNRNVDITAPGVSIRSTVPTRAIVDASGTLHQFRYLDNSRKHRNPVSGLLRYCDTGKSDYNFQGVQGRICLIKRGGGLFQDTSMRCQENGGIGAIIFNNSTGEFRGTIAEDGGVQIPVVGVTLDSGNMLQRSERATITQFAGGYETKSGTSMAVPFVSGVAAKMWAANPLCTHEQIREAILSTAKTDGLYAGRDSENRDIEFSHAFGKGLIQAQAAYDALQQMPYPCGGRSLPVSSPLTPRPTPEPIPANVVSAPRPVPSQFNSWTATTVFTPGSTGPDVSQEVVPAPAPIIDPVDFPSPQKDWGSWTGSFFGFGISSPPPPPLSAPSLEPGYIFLSTAPSPTGTGSSFVWLGAGHGGGRGLRGSKREHDLH